MMLTFLICISCGDDSVTGPPVIKASKGKITVFDTKTDSVAVGIRIELYYVLIQKGNSFSSSIFSLAPNPFYDFSTFEYEVLDPVDVEISIAEIISGKSYKIIGLNAPSGYHSQIFNLSNFSEINPGFYRAYYKQKNVAVDSLNLIYCNLEQANLLSQEGIFFMLNKLTDSTGVINLEDLNPNWVGQGITITSETGQKINSLKVSNQIKIYLYDANNVKIREMETDFTTLISDGLLIKL